MIIVQTNIKLYWFIMTHDYDKTGNFQYDYDEFPKNRWDSHMPSWKIPQQ